MPAYIIADVTVTNPEAYAEYRQHTPSSLLPYGGRFVIRGGAYETLEGDWKPDRLVAIEFPNMVQLKSWYTSPEYQKIISIRHRASTGRLIAIEGA